jgi:hypothetical protein
MATKKTKGNNSVIKQTAESIKSVAKEYAAEKSHQVIGNAFGGSLVGRVMQSTSEKMFGKVDQRGMMGATVLQTQQQMAATMMRVEIIAQNVSDNLYNIAGILNAQLTSMEQTRRDMRIAKSREQAISEEATLEKIAGGNKEGGLLGDAARGAGLIRALSSPLVVGGLVTGVLAAVAKFLANRGLEDPSARSAPINRVRRGEATNLREAGAMNQREALKARSTITQGVADDIMSVLIKEKWNGAQAAAFIREFSPEADLYYIIDKCSPALRKKYLETVGEVIPDKKPVKIPAPIIPKSLSTAGAGRGSQRTYLDSNGNEVNTPDADTIENQVAIANGLAPVYDAKPVPGMRPGVSGTGGIGAAESGNNYDVAFGDRADKQSGEISNSIGLVTAKEFGGKSLSEMTLAEVQRFQTTRNFQKQGTGAVGKYQFMPNTLFGKGGLVEKAGLSMNDKFSPANQEKMNDILQQQNKNTLQGAGVAPTPGNMYMAHYIGAGGAIAVNQAAKRGEDITVAQALVKAGHRDPTSNNPELARLKVGSFEQTLASRLGAPSGTVVGAAPNTGAQVATQSTQVAAAQSTPVSAGNTTIVNNNTSGGNQVAGRRAIPSPIADRGSLDQNVTFVAAA